MSEGQSKFLRLAIAGQLVGLTKKPAAEIDAVVSRLNLESFLNDGELDEDAITDFAKQLGTGEPQTPPVVRSLAGELHSKGIPAPKPRSMRDIQEEARKRVTGSN